MYAEAAGRGPAGARREHARWGGPRRHWVRAGLGVARRGMRMTGRGRCVSAGAARSGLCAVRADAQRGAGAPRRARARGAPADGRREVRVERRGQAVVRILGRRGVAAAKVGRLRHAARGQDAQQRVEVGVVRPHRRVQRRGQRLRWGRTRAQPRARAGPHARRDARQAVWAVRCAARRVVAGDQPPRLHCCFQRLRPCGVAAFTRTRERRQAEGLNKVSLQPSASSSVCCSQSDVTGL